MKEAARKPFTEFVQALEELDVALDENVHRSYRIKQHIRAIRNAYADNLDLPDEDLPLIVHMLTASQRVLNEQGAKVRRTEARALRARGMTMDQIGDLFGVTRQRVSRLLNGGAPEEPVARPRTPRDGGG